jgi:SAM-dependent methyltransferase
MAKTPWQIQLFDKTLKKKQRFNELKGYLGTLRSDQRCLLVTCGDNNGAMNYKLRELGGDWSFADLEDFCIEEMSELLGKEVPQVPHDRLPYENDYFDIVVTIDVHEHLDDPVPFCGEVRRVAKPGAQVIFTVPNGDETKLAVKLKHTVGMSNEDYGHSRVGLTIPQLYEMMKACRITPQRSSTFSKFFTEILELTINFVYVKVIAPRSRTEIEKGQIAPATSTQVKSVRKLLLAYSIIYPVYSAISRLDGLLRHQEGYVVVAEGTKQ